MGKTDATMYGSPEQPIRIAMIHVVTAAEMRPEAGQNVLNDVERHLSSAFDALIEREDWVLISGPDLHRELGPSRRHGEQVSDDGDVLVEVAGTAWRRVEG